VSENFASVIFCCDKNCNILSVKRSLQYNFSISVTLAIHDVMCVHISLTVVHNIHLLLVVTEIRVATVLTA